MIYQCEKSNNEATLKRLELPHSMIQHRKIASQSRTTTLYPRFRVSNPRFDPPPISG